jgi:nitroreductase
MRLEMTTNAVLPDFETIARIIRSRRATRHFLCDPIPQGLLEQLIELARWAPSGYNLQPTHFVAVTDPDVREALVPACLDQVQIREAPAVIVLTADRKVARHHFEDMLRMEHEAGSMPPAYEALLRWTIPLAFGHGPIGLGWLWKATLLPLVRMFRPVPELPAVHMRFWLAKQASLCAMNLMLATEAAGLASVPMEGFDESRVHQVLAIPRTHVVVLIVAIGYPAPLLSKKTRLSLERILHHDRW